MPRQGGWRLLYPHWVELNGFLSLGFQLSSRPTVCECQFRAFSRRKAVEARIPGPGTRLNHRKMTQQLDHLSSLHPKYPSLTVPGIRICSSLAPHAPLWRKSESAYDIYCSSALWGGRTRFLLTDESQGNRKGMVFAVFHAFHPVTQLLLWPLLPTVEWPVRPLPACFNELNQVIRPLLAPSQGGCPLALWMNPTPSHPFKAK